MNQSLDEKYPQANTLKRKMTAVMAVAMHSEDMPHLVDVGIRNPQGVVVWFTVEPYGGGQSDMGFQGWDVERERMWSWKMEEIYDISVNSRFYRHVSEEEWKLRIAETNLQFSEDMVITCHKGRFWR